jgi:DNA (cytosine-5)-methyltransferase 1
MQAMPRLLAHYGQEAWQDGSWENAVPRMSRGVANRVDRLRGLGNGQVPAVVALAWETLTTQPDLFASAGPVA